MVKSKMLEHTAKDFKEAKEKAKHWLRQQPTIFAKKIAPVYKVLEWDWHDKGVPSEEEIKKRLQRMVKSFLEKPETTKYLGGGLYVQIEPEYDGPDNILNWEISLGFDCNASNWIYYGEG